MPKIGMVCEESSWSGDYLFSGPEVLGFWAYKEYKDVLLRSGYPSKGMGKIKARCYEYIPGAWLGLREEGRLVGVCAARFGPLKKMSVPLSASIEALAVIPEVRGKGIASMLVSHVLMSVLDAGYEKVFVAVHTERPAAVRVYEKTGFRRIK